MLSHIKLLPKLEKRYFLGLLLLMCISAVLDVIGIASIIPFMTVAANPELIQENAEIFSIFIDLNSKSESETLIILGLITLGLFSLSIITKGLLTYSQLRFAYRCEYTFAKNLLQTYLKADYKWLISKNSTELVKNMLSEVQQYITSALLPLLRFISQSLAAICIICFLLFYNFQITIFTVATLSLAFLMIYVLLRRSLQQLGEQRLTSNDNRFTSAIEAISLYKFATIDSVYSFLISRFTRPAKKYSNVFAAVQIISQLPRYLLEFTAFGGVISLVLFLLLYEEMSPDVFLPTLSLFALAAYKLMPALQQVFSAAAQLTSTDAILDRIIHLMAAPQRKKLSYKVMDNWKTITISNINFKYSPGSSTIINNLDLSIDKGKVYGIAGASGSGKSTLMNILLGLLQSDTSLVQVDGVPVPGFYSLMDVSKISYALQTSYFIDGTIADNITLGIDQNLQDETKMKHCMKVAMFNEVLKEQFNNNIYSEIGENGSVLSGGQRQRLGIARALYHDGDIVILDEPTSALDQDLAEQLIKNIRAYCRIKALIIITHSSSILSSCDEIIDINLDGQA